MEIKWTKKEAYVTIAIMAMRGNVNSVVISVTRTTESVRTRTVIRGIFKNGADVYDGCRVNYK